MLFVYSLLKSLLLQVITPPKMDAFGDRTAIEVVEGHTVTLECPLSTPVDVINIEWFKNGHAFTVCCCYSFYCRITRLVLI